MSIPQFVQSNLTPLIVSTASSIIVGLLKAILSAIKSSNKLLASHDNRITVCENTLSKIPCVQNGFSCHKE